MEIRLVNQNEFRITKLKKSGASVMMRNSDGGGVVELTREIDGKETKMTFDRPGEYEVSGVGLVGIKVETGVIFVLHVEEMILAHLDGVKELTEKQTAAIGPVDVAMVMASNDSVKLVKAINPSIAIPVGDSAAVDEFVEKMGVEKNLSDKLVVNKIDLPEETSVIVLG